MSTSLIDERKSVSDEAILGRFCDSFGYLDKSKKWPIYDSWYFENETEHGISNLSS